MNKKSWQTKKLGEIVKLEYGKPLSKEKRIVDGLYPVYGANGEKDRTNKFYFDQFSIIVGRKGSAGELNLTDERFWPLDVTYFVTFDNKKYDLKFIFNLLLTLNLTTLAKGVKPGINRNDVYSLVVNVPKSLFEQKRIVKKLDEAFEKIEKAKENTENNLQNSRKFYSSYLNDIFNSSKNNWERKSIGKVCNLMTGGTPSRNKKEYFDGGKIKWLVSGDIKKREISDCNGRITKLGLKNSNTKFLPINSVMIALNGQGKTRGTVALLHVKATCNQSLVSIYPKDVKELLPEYIFYNLDSRYDELRKMTGDSGNDRRGLNMILIRKIEISYPKSISKQRRLVKEFSDVYNKTKRLEEIYKQKFVDLEELKKSILNEAFFNNL